MVDSEATLVDEELKSLIHEMVEVVDGIQSRADVFLDSLNAKELPTENGVSLLQTKGQLLVEYIQFVVGLVALKINKESFTSPIGMQLIHGLIENRVMLEKLGPIEKKLKYQLDKFIRTAKLSSNDISISNEGGNMLSYAPNPEDMADDDDYSDNDEDSKGKDKSSQSGNIYMPPKNRLVEYEEDMAKEKSIQKSKEKLLRKAQSSELVNILREEFSEAPLEEKVYGIDHRIDLDDKDMERINFEEDNFIRLAIPKKEMAKKKKKNRIGEFDDFDSFSDLSTRFEKLKKKEETKVDFDALRAKAVIPSRGIKGDDKGHNKKRKERIQIDEVPEWKRKQGSNNRGKKRSKGR